MLVRNLQQIPVSRDKSDLNAGALCLLCQRAKNIIRLKPRLLHDDNAHRPQHILHHRHLLAQLLRHGLSRSLICLIHLVPEGRRMDVERYREIIRLFLFQYLKHDVQESVDGIGMQSLRIRQLGDSVKGSVQNAVSVDQDKLFAITHL